MTDALLSPPMLLAGLLAAARIGIACLLAAAAIAKLRRRDDFARAVAGYRLLPDAAVSPVAAALPPVELLLAAGLVAGWPSAAIATAGLLALFAAAMAVNLLRGRRAIDCGCDPTAKPKPIGWGLVLRNLALGGMLLLGGLVALPRLPLPLLGIAGGAGVIGFLLAYILTLLGSFAPRAPARASGAR